MTTAAALRAWRHANPEKVREQRRRNRSKNREKLIASLKAWRSKNKEHVKRYTSINHKRWYEANKEKMREKSRQWRILNIEHVVASRHEKKFGLKKDQYAKLVARQTNLCAICSKPSSSRKRLAVDHCHTSGRVRGLLCDRCNMVLGKDLSIAQFRLIIDYLESSFDGRDL